MAFLWFGRNNAVLFYGANIGDGALVTPHKGSHLKAPDNLGEKPP